MRCPKCGFISFDRQKSCGKCTADLTAVSEQLQGTVGKAATPFFLGSVLGRQTLDEDEPATELHEEEDSLLLDELEDTAPPTDEDELDFAGAPLDENDMAEPILPSLGLEDIDVSDLVPPQEDAEEPVLSLGDEQEEEAILDPIPPPADEEGLSGIEFPGFDSADILNVEGKEPPSADDFEDTAASSQNTTEDEEIIDLSSLMDFDETPAKQEDQEHHDILDLSFDGEEDARHTADAPEKPASGGVSIADLGLTLENDDH